MDEWRDISGQTLLERFGMTETLMALSNPYKPVERRIKGRVGKPLPGVEAALLSLEEAEGG
jgi:malonyl-CoA/methylmalonyl-CoA synthetase